MKKYILIAAVALTAVMANASDFNTKAYTYTVKEGDTLFTIVKSEYGESVNAMDKMIEIQEDNNLNLNKSYLQPGQQLILKK